MVRARWYALAGIAAVMVIATVVLALRGASTQEPVQATQLTPQQTATLTDRTITPVCGFSGDLLSRLVADRPKDTEVAAPRGFNFEVPSGQAIHQIASVDGSISVERGGPDGVHHVDIFDYDGKPVRSFSFDFSRDKGQPAHGNGLVALAPDGTVYAIDSYEGRRNLAQFDATGRQIASYSVPSSAETTGHPLDLQGVTWVGDIDGAPALLVGERTTTVHVFRPTGELVGTKTDVPSDILNAVGSGSIATAVDVGARNPNSDADVAQDFIVREVSSGEVGMRVTNAAEHQRYGVSTTPRVNRITSILPGPDGEGFILLDPLVGIEWVSAVGVHKGVWMNEQQPGSPIESAGAAYADGTYWFVVQAEGGQRMIHLSEAELKSRLLEPLNPTSSNMDVLAQLGIGVGAVTDAVLNHFDHGAEPKVTLRTEQGWGMLGAHDGAGELQVRYTVAGDPTIAEPVVQEAKFLDVPVGGGEETLALPRTQPGAYEVDLALIDKSSRAVLSGACLRYSVGAEGSEFKLDELADGADWGGAGPLRGVQLAHRLGIGSHRVQLPFDQLVPKPQQEPSPGSVNWAALPGSGTGGATGSIEGYFAELREAGVYAEANGVTMIVQLAANGEAERQAVEAGTWAQWSRLIIDEFIKQVPQAMTWSPWNEPNTTFSSAADYFRRVELPFIEVAHAAAPQLRVLAGNTLGFATDWWKDAEAAGLCSVADAIAVHPYTGWNRSWEEEGFEVEGHGFDALKSVLGPSCATLPIYDTESGWWADGAVPYWGQGSNVARKLLWYRQEQVAAWTYFFSEGGWGEGNLSWSLVQFDGHVKPGGLAFAAVARQLRDRGRPTTSPTGIPFTYAMDFSNGSKTPMVTVWTSEMRIDAKIVSDAAEVTVTDQYGATRVVPMTGGEARLTLTATPQFLSAPEGTAVRVQPLEAFGDDLLRGLSVGATSTHSESDPAVITSGTVNPNRPWRSGNLTDGTLDQQPSVQVDLPKATLINRIAVASGSISCCEAGLRDYTVSVLTANGEWKQVGTPSGQYWQRVAMLEFGQIEARAVKIDVPWFQVRGTRMLSVNYTGKAGGLPIPPMGVQTESDYVVSVSALSAWGPSA